MPDYAQRRDATGHLNFRLPSGQTLALASLDVTVGTLIDIARGVLRDDPPPWRTSGVENHFFLLNRSTGTLIVNRVLATFALSNLSVESSQEIEFCFTPAHPNRHG